MPNDLGLALVTVIVSLWCVAHTQNYEDIYRLEQSLFTNYSTNLRPLSNQSHKVQLRPGFAMICLIEVNEKQQSFSINGFLTLTWTDERLQWNPSDYNDVTSFAPALNSVWRPRMLMMNTVEARDPFEDDYAPLRLANNGTIFWAPGGLFHSVCVMDLRKYPADEHSCTLVLAPMNMGSGEVEFVVETGADINMDLFIENGEWELKNTLIMEGFDIITNQVLLVISLRIARRPTFFIINTLIPVISLGLLNALSFTIPVDSGEKVSYSVSVLLAFSVYLSIVNDQLPTNSVDMPYVTRYIFILFTMSVCCCIDNLVIVHLYHKEEEDKRRDRRESKFESANTKLRYFNFFKKPNKPTEDDLTEQQNGVALPRISEVSQYNTMEDPMEKQSNNEIDADDAVAEDGFGRVVKGSQPSILGKINFGRHSKVAVEPTATNRITQKAQEATKKRNYKNLARKINNVSLVVFCVLTTLLTVIHIVVLSI